jgi:hypothetical protein
VVVLAYNPSYSRSGGRRILSFETSPAKSIRSYLKNNPKAKGQEGHGLSSTVLA